MSLLPFPSDGLSDGIVTLRLWAPGDAPARAVACSDPEIVRWTDLPETYSEADAAVDIRRGLEHRERGERLSLAVTDGAGEVVGGIDLIVTLYERAELGYVIAATHRRRGLATRAVQLLANWAFARLPIARIELPIPTGNHASAGVARRAGFTDEGLLRSYLALRDGGPRHDVVMYSLLTAPE